MSEKNERKVSGFWSTLPGVLTAVASVIAAVGGRITVLYTTGIIGRHQPSAPVAGVGESRPSEEAEMIPSLAVPQDGSTVSQPYRQPWVFRWDEPRAPGNVRQYHLRVFGASAAYPVADVKVSGTEHTIRGRECSYIIDNHRLGWKWEVRAQFQDGTWGPWAGPSTFNVSPFNKDAYCQQCPDADVCQR